ncbi:uncharacterized protein LOC116345865 [Contarinia nasturtii]|uniref:uncharacterized protein LOC116345865 n=1 Tax=Contarinia nasturtii TaxID=265458 RepID=UPI0012D41414|nr:uncharacterized protein LOC116345865 [Contarinia nasturtii]
MAIDLDDILNDKFMPMSILYDKGTINADGMSIVKSDQKQVFPISSNADFDSAIHLMQFHRKMIQNYKCNNYIAKQILADIAPHTLHNRLGIAHNSSEIVHLPKHRPMWNNNFDDKLFDQGSNAYKNWLTKLALLDDVYKQIKADNLTMKNLNETPPFRRIDGASVSGDNEYEVGVASGYAIQHPIPSGFVPPQNHANDIDYENFHRYAVAGNKAVPYIQSINTLFEQNQNPSHSLHQPPVFVPDENSDLWPNSYPNLYAISHPYHNPHVFYSEPNELPPIKNVTHSWWSFQNLKEKFQSFFKHKNKQNDDPHHSANLFNNNQQQFQGYDVGGDDYGVSYDSSGGSSKEMTLKKVYELALTAIAYLAFGIFVLQVIMCITTVKAQTGSTMVMAEVPTETVEMTEVRDEIIRRKKRSNIETSFSDVNEMSRKVLQSIEAAMVAPEDNGNCLKQILCQNNQFKSISINQIWLPVWGLGMSWLSSRITTGQINSPIMFECLKALIIGLGDGVCEENFQCDSNIIANNRKLTRQMRSTK